MTNLETCCRCNQETGKAGRHEDSIYLETDYAGEIGPLCESCAAQYWTCDKCGRVAQLASFAGLDVVENGFKHLNGDCGGTVKPWGEQ